MTEILEDAKLCLQQGIELLETLQGEDYSTSLEAYSSHSIGAHIRHNLDHFNSFFLGCREGFINYDERTRDPKIENDKEYTIGMMNSLVFQLSELKPDELEREVSIQMDSGDVSERTMSSIRRELQFLISHTIHHYAIIALICNIKEIQVPENFGVAPSTLKFRKQSQQACAH